MDIDSAITKVRDAATRVEAAHLEVAAAKQALHRAALRALVDVTGEDDERELVRRLYWDVPDLPVKTLEVALGASSRVRDLAGPGPLIGSCDGCGKELRATSRSSLTRRPERCPSCERERRRAWAHAAAAYDDDWYEEVAPPLHLPRLVEIPPPPEPPEEGSAVAPETGPEPPAADGPG